MAISHPPQDQAQMGGELAGSITRCMNSLALTLTLLLGSLSARADEVPAWSIVKLPRPNSGTFTFEQAETRKSEILTNSPTQKLEHWKNPYMGFCVHIGKDDDLTVYGHFLNVLQEHRDPRGRQSVADLKRLSDELPLLGNPAGILITSDLPLKNSKAIHEGEFHSLPASHSL